MDEATIVCLVGIITLIYAIYQLFFDRSAQPYTVDAGDPNAPNSVRPRQQRGFPSQGMGSDSKESSPVVLPIVGKITKALQIDRELSAVTVGLRGLLTTEKEFVASSSSSSSSSLTSAVTKSPGRILTEDEAKIINALGSYVNVFLLAPVSAEDRDKTIASGSENSYIAQCASLCPAIPSHRILRYTTDIGRVAILRQLNPGAHIELEVIASRIDAITPYLKRILSIKGREADISSGSSKVGGDDRLDHGQGQEQEQAVKIRSGVLDQGVVMQAMSLSDVLGFISASVDTDDNDKEKQMSVLPQSLTPIRKL
jgi:hypothetical protein